MPLKLFYHNKNMKLVSDDYPETNEKEKIRLALIRYSWQ